MRFVRSAKVATTRILRITHQRNASAAGLRYARPTLVSPATARVVNPVIKNPGYLMHVLHLQAQSQLEMATQTLDRDRMLESALEIEFLYWQAQPQPKVATQTLDRGRFLEPSV